MKRVKCMCRIGIFFLMAFHLLADEVVILQNGQERRIQGIVTVLKDGSIKVEIPNATLTLAQGQWKPESLVRGDPCDQLGIHEGFISYFADRGDYKSAIDELESVRKNRCPSKKEDAFYRSLKEALWYCHYSFEIDAAISRLTKRDFNQIFGQFLTKKAVKNLQQEPAPLDALVADVKAIVEEARDHATTRVVEAFKYDILRLYADTGQVLVKKSGLKAKAVDKILKSHWETTFSPKVSDQMPFFKKLWTKRASLADTAQAWQAGEQSATYAFIDVSISVMRQDWENAVFSLQNYAGTSEMYAQIIGDMHKMEIPVKNPTTGAPTTALGSIAAKEIPPDLTEFYESDSYRSILGCALQMYNAGPGTCKRYRGRVPYPSTIQYAYKILNVYQNKPQLLEPHTQFDAIIQGIIYSVNADPDLHQNFVKSVIYQESRFNAEASGLAGEKGLMQIMENTWNGMFQQGTAPGCSFYEKGHDPTCNITMGVTYLNQALIQSRAFLERDAAMF